MRGEGRGRTYAGVLNGYALEVFVFVGDTEEAGGEVECGVEHAVSALNWSVDVTGTSIYARTVIRCDTRASYR